MPNKKYTHTIIQIIICIHISYIHTALHTHTHIMMHNNVHMLSYIIAFHFISIILICPLVSKPVGNTIITVINWFCVICSNFKFLALLTLVFDDHCHIKIWKWQFLDHCWAHIYMSDYKCRDVFIVKYMNSSIKNYLLRAETWRIDCLYI